MNTITIPDDIRRFIILRVPSVPYLEATLLMRAERQSAWSRTALASRLYLSESDVSNILQQLQADGIVTDEANDACFRYAPASAELDELLGRLAEVYARNLIAISTLIHSKTSGKAQVLADAFVWKRDK